MKKLNCTLPVAFMIMAIASCNNTENNKADVQPSKTMNAGIIKTDWGNTPMKPSQYYEFSSWQSFQYVAGQNSWLAVLFVAFALIQILFILYTITRLIVKK